MSPGAVLVTGASSGIGQSIVDRLHRRGLRVFGGFRKPEDGVRLSDTGVVPIRLDVTDPHSVAAARSSILAAGEEGLAGLVNNAGIPGAGPVELTPIDDYRRVMEVNFFGALSVTQTFLPLVRRGNGRVVMISSLSGVISTPFMSPYSASKFALEALSDGLRRELLHEGLDVVVIEPGPIRTSIWDRVGEIDQSRYAGSPYAEALERRCEEALESGRRGLPPDAAARAVERALTARRPPARIIVTRGRWKIRIARMLPDRWVDRLLAGRAV